MHDDGAVDAAVLERRGVDLLLEAFQHAPVALQQRLLVAVARQAAVHVLHAHPPAVRAHARDGVVGGGGAVEQDPHRARAQQVPGRAGALGPAGLGGEPQRERVELLAGEGHDVGLHALAQERVALLDEHGLVGDEVVAGGERAAQAARLVPLLVAHGEAPVAPVATARSIAVRNSGPARIAASRTPAARSASRLWNRIGRFATGKRCLGPAGAVGQGRSSVPRPARIRAFAISICPATDRDADSNRASSPTRMKNGGGRARWSPMTAATVPELPPSHQSPAAVLVCDDDWVRHHAARLLGDAGIAVSARDDARPGHGDELVLLLLEGPVAARLARVRDAAARHPRAPVLVTLPAGAGGAVLRRALHAGASGVVLDDELPATLVATAYALACGQLAVPRSLRRRLVPPALSHREKEILRMVVTGHTNRQIAAALFVAESTVKTHLSSAFTKLDARSRAEATALILDPEDGYGPAILDLAGGIPAEDPATALPLSHPMQANQAGERNVIQGERVLITGGAGAIGSNLADLLVQRGAGEIVILDNFVRGRRDNLEWAEANGPVTVVEGDICDRDARPRADARHARSSSTRPRCASRSAPRSRGSRSRCSSTARSTCSRRPSRQACARSSPPRRRRSTASPRSSRPPRITTPTPTTRSTAPPRCSTRACCAASTR